MTNARSLLLAPCTDSYAAQPNTNIGNPSAPGEIKLAYQQRSTESVPWCAISLSSCFSSAAMDRSSSSAVDVLESYKKTKMYLLVKRLIHHLGTDTLLELNAHYNVV